MSKPLDDEQAQERIEELEQEEQRLRRDEAKRPTLNSARRFPQTRSSSRRRGSSLTGSGITCANAGLRDAGQDPDGAAMRDAGTVERYVG